ncbi:GlmU family protein [Mangrovibacterium lignilyticum]|uniref:GlmU family protein n=1 Tax=Mangrovibacterium lignilyticum TaxID=2668052 RepID=UPI0013D7E1A0|nr:GlmU family protein [Mangrovibacterium lignilyticum]
MNIILFETDQRNCLLPLCYTRPVASLRTGILTIFEKWKLRLSGNYSFKTELYLKEKFPLTLAEDNLLISAHICPNDELAKQVKELKSFEGIKWQGIPVALRVPAAQVKSYPALSETIKWDNFDGHLDNIRYAWDLNEASGNQFQLDFELVTAGRQSAPLSGSNNVIAPENIFVEEGARVEFATINASAGPVYVGKGAEIMEGALIRGPLALGEHSVVNLGSKIYGPVSIGPYCRVGGEISHSILIGYSNKGHDGFLGHSVLGEWCNLGAGTNVSNLKNTYDKVKVWSYPEGKFVRTGLQFCGLIMGDHSKAGINTMFNTGTVVGVGCNIHGAGFPRQFVPSFSDGGVHGYKVHQLKTVFGTAAQVMARRSTVLTDADQRLLTAIFDKSAVSRKF